MGSFRRPGRTLRSSEAVAGTADSGHTSRCGGGASQSNLPGRPTRRRPVHAGNLALRIVHDRVQPLGRGSVRGVHSGRLDRGHETHRPPSPSAVRVGPTAGIALSPGSAPHRGRPAEKSLTTKAGRRDRRQYTLPTGRTERRSPGSTPLRIGLRPPWESRSGGKRISGPGYDNFPWWCSHQRTLRAGHLGNLTRQRKT
jgi:hypothetical protein